MTCTDPRSRASDTTPTRSSRRRSSSFERDSGKRRQDVDVVELIHREDHIRIGDCFRGEPRRRRGRAARVRAAARRPARARRRARPSCACVPADATRTSVIPAARSSSRRKPAAAALRMMLPWHTNSTERTGVGTTPRGPPRRCGATAVSRTVRADQQGDGATPSRSKAACWARSRAA